MKTSKKWLVTAVLMAACFGVSGVEIAARAQTAATPPAAAPAPSRIAVVNIVDLFSKLLEKAQADTELANTSKKIQEEASSRDAEIERLKKALGTYNPQSDQYKQALNDLQEKAVAKDIWAQVNKAKYDADFQNRTILLYKKINDAIADYAKANRIALVFVADSADMDNLRGDQLAAVVSTRKLMYFDPSYDITSALVLKMNQEFQMRTPAKP